MGKKRNVNVATTDCCFLTVGTSASWFLSPFHLFLIFLHRALYFNGGRQISDATRFERLSSCGAAADPALPLVPGSAAGACGVACGRGALWPCFVSGARPVHPRGAFSACSIRTGFSLQGDVMLQGFNENFFLIKISEEVISL